MSINYEIMPRLSVRDFERLLKAAANRRRLMILQYLKKARRAPVADIASEINLSLKSTSKHLIILFAAEIIEREQVNVQMFYFLSQKQSLVIKQLLSLL